ncbi:MAG TPA: tetratricopeptide repeat protein [Terriglobia bacterium]|nr:tetratricopeptide repeat protein [Terriglobia bacterium]
MPLLKNRIGLSLLLILLGAYLWEFYAKPVSGPLYTAAVNEYRARNYEKSLRLLSRAYEIDPNDTSVLTLMGWNYLKMGREEPAREKFSRAHRLAPGAPDTILGYADTEASLGHYAHAFKLLSLLNNRGSDSADLEMAWGSLYRHIGRNGDAAREFERVLALRPNDALAIQNLQQLYNLTGALTPASLRFPAVTRPTNLTYPFRVDGNSLETLEGNAWEPVYLTGVDLNAALPGSFPVESVTDAGIYLKWLQMIGSLGVNTVHAATILPPAFYRAFYLYDRDNSHPPLWLLQGITFPATPPDDDFFQKDYYQSCLKEIREAVDVAHGQGDVASNHLHSGGLYPNPIDRWVAGFVVGDTWLSHLVLDNNALHPRMQSYQGDYIEVPSGSPTEIFLAQMIDHLEEYEEGRYNWQHPAAFLNWPTLDPMRHPTESTMAEEIAIRRALGERFQTPQGPYNDDDSVTVDPGDLKPTIKFRAGYFADYTVFPFYPDFLDLDPSYLEATDSEGMDPFLGYLQDLKAHTEGLPLVISAYGIPTSLGIGHFNAAGFNEGGQTETQQGNLLARFTRNIYDSGAAGGMVFEWLDEWFRRSWLTRNYETPEEDKPRWTNLMDPAEYYGLIAADPGGREAHQLDGNPLAWNNRPAFYSKAKPGLFQPAGDRWDPARDLKALYVDADEGFLYLRLVVGKLADDKTGRPNWDAVNYLIGIGTDPGHAGITYLPFIAPVRFPQGMTFAVQLAGPEASHLWIASSYNPYEIIPVEGIPSDTALGQKLGWTPELTDQGTFEGEIVEPNRRRFARNGRYFPPERYDRGILRYGTLDPSSPDYDPLAEWHANVQTNTIDVRIPWALLNVTDPSTLGIFAGLEKDGTVKTTRTPGFILAAFSYRPVQEFRMRPIMEQGHPIADALPALAGPLTISPDSLRKYTWASWTQPQYVLRKKESYGLLQKAFLALPKTPLSSPATGGHRAPGTGLRGHIFLKGGGSHSR